MLFRNQKDAHEGLSKNWEKKGYRRFDKDEKWWQ